MKNGALDALRPARAFHAPSALSCRPKESGPRDSHWP